MITTTEIMKEMALWWMFSGAMALLLVACFTIGSWLDKKFPEDKISKKILGKKLYKILHDFL